MDEVNWLRFVLAFAFVLALIGLFAWSLKRWPALSGLGLRRAAGGRQRLEVVEMCYLGPRHRLALVRRDGVEHLLLLGPDTSTVIESGIASALPPPARERSKEGVRE